VASGAPVVSIGLEASNEEDVVDAHVVVLLLDFFFFLAPVLKNRAPD
jgi:hypothetical protein